MPMTPERVTYVIAKQADQIIALTDTVERLQRENIELITAAEKANPVKPKIASVPIPKEQPE